MVNVAEFFQQFEKYTGNISEDEIKMSRDNVVKELELLMNRDPKVQD